MTTKKYIRFEFTKEEKQLIMSMKEFVEDLGYDEFDVLKQITKQADIIDSINILWDLAFEDDEIPIDE